MAIPSELIGLFNSLSLNDTLARLVGHQLCLRSDAEFPFSHARTQARTDRQGGQLFQIVHFSRLLQNMDVQ